MRSDLYQIALIFLGIVATVLFGAFIYREIFPEYKIYQDDFIQLEKFRSSYTGETPAPFKAGIQQIVIEREDKGPPEIDRCISCHVALQIPDYSTTKIDYDINGNAVLDTNGWPVKVPNPDYIWKKLDQKIDELTDAKVNEQLKAEGETGKVYARLKEAETLKLLKTAQVDDQVYDVRKVLTMHPLIGKETRPFEFHPVEEYACTSCHNGNGRGLTTDKAHGPVFDGQYDIEFEGYVPQFTEPDPLNDPIFAREFNHKPGDHLIFQTTPIFVGALIEAKCVQCHQSSQTMLQEALNSTKTVTEYRKDQSQEIATAFSNEKKALTALVQMRLNIEKNGVAKTLADLKKRSEDYTIPHEELKQIHGQIEYLTQAAGNEENKSIDEKHLLEKALKQIDHEINDILGSPNLAHSFVTEFNAVGMKTKENPDVFVDSFLKEHLSDPDAAGSIFLKFTSVNLNQELLRHIEESETSFAKAVNNPHLMSAITSDVDLLTKHYQRGQKLFISQACYACHRIAGFSRGGVGPELTQSGKGYPWYLKESIVWPQADIPTSTMPNYQLDHAELQDLMTFLLGQRGENKALSGTAYKMAIQSWDTGRKLPWEKPITPVQMNDLRYAMTVFATEGCSACHKLKGFESNVGYSIEKEKKDKVAFQERYQESQWFTKLFPEEIIGSEIVAAIEKHSDEIDRRIVNDVRQGSILEEIEKMDPKNIESLYSPFQYALRAKNFYFKTLASAENNPEKKEKIMKEWDLWKDRVHRVLMMYVQEYGLGRLVGPRPNWSGIFRSDEWLMEHFHNPTGHSPRSIMPIFPFDDSKFYALTHMLDVLAKRNRDEVRAIWEHNGFSPELAVHIHCAQCHGEFLQGNGPVSVWIYPIPKNLHNADFLRNLTKERVIQSITHGVKGTPMPPWGEVAKDKPTADNIPVLNAQEIERLADWLFSSLPGGTVIKSSQDVLKWEYSPEDVLKDLHNEGQTLKPGKPEDIPESSERTGKAESHLGRAAKIEIPPEFAALPTGAEYYAALRDCARINCTSGLRQSPGIERSEMTQYYNMGSFPIVQSRELSRGPDAQFIFAQSLNPQVPSNIQSGKKENLDVSDVFDILPSPVPGPDKYGYYIKRKYYTAQNIESGRQFFEMNCAVCHGTEADGTGPRSEAMRDAKPRMLINLDWLNTRDDLRLLRSIKFGVSGTAMTPWGDLTSSLQRLQLVIFIRSLSHNQELSNMLSSAIYQAFDHASYLLENARIKEYAKLANIQEQLNETQNQLSLLADRIQKGTASVQDALAAYQKELALTQELKQRQNRDRIYLDLKELVVKEKNLYESIGKEMLTAQLDQDAFTQFLELIKLNENLYSLKDGNLSFHIDEIKENEISKLNQKIIDTLEKKISSLQNEKIIVEGKIPSVERNEQLSTLSSQITALNKLRIHLISGLEECQRVRQKQKNLFKELASQPNEKIINHQQNKIDQ